MLALAPTLKFKVGATASPGLLEDLVRYDISATSKTLRKYTIDFVSVTDKRHGQILLIEADGIGTLDPLEV